MSTKTGATLVLVMSLVISGCTSVQVVEPTPTSTSTFTPIPSQTLSPTATMTPTPIASTTDCDKWNLTPEECANTGTHEYSTSTQITFDQTGQSCTIDNSNIVFSIEFQSQETFLITDPYRTKLEFTRQGQNIFSGGYTQPDGKFEWKGTITFTANGFVEESSSYDLDQNELLCTFVWEQEIIGLPVTKTPLPPNSFQPYDSSEDKKIDEYGLRETVPDFSLEYPPEWQYGWFGDSGVIGLLISSGDPNEAWTGQDTSGAMIMIIPMPYEGEKPTDLFLGYDRADKIIQEPISLSINGQDATKVKYINNDVSQTEVLIVVANWALLAVYSLPTVRQEDFLPLLEKIVSSIEIR